MTILFLVAAHVSAISKLMQFHILLVCTAYRRRRFSGAVFIPGIFGGDFPQNLQPPQTAAKLCSIVNWKTFSKFRANVLTLVTYTLDRFSHFRLVTYFHHENILLADTKTGNCSPLSKSKGANLCLKCIRIRLAAGLRPHPLGEPVRAYALLQIP